MYDSEHAPTITRGLCARVQVELRVPVDHPHKMPAGMYQHTGGPMLNPGERSLGERAAFTWVRIQTPDATRSV
jgi:hypothetical protein